MQPIRAVQILIELAAADPAAVTARETIRRILGFGDRLRVLRRRSFLELRVEELPPSPSADQDALPEAVQRYLATTLELWNPSRDRGWVRIERRPDPALTWECVSGRRRPSPFGLAPSEEESAEHLLSWRRGGGGVPADLAAGLAPYRILAAGGATLYSLAWREGASREERREWTGAVGPVRSRRHGLLVHPASEVSLHVSGGLPCPLFEAGAELGSESAATRGTR